ncbi:hypothetical protein NPIL_485581 [Nephila pilipes]|uniref:Uncharacterized protein n=1 Tax=Nephila pilipes TaxID=299642 RepID=A0A8X6NJA2_NEPPI|nr:hypothetical protein NPIL_485581 [Nephila pilipes]
MLVFTVNTGKPSAFSGCNKTKGKVFVANQLRGTYTVVKRTLSGSLVIFYSFLNYYRSYKMPNYAPKVITRYRTKVLGLFEKKNSIITPETTFTAKTMIPSLLRSTKNNIKHQFIELENAVKKEPTKKKDRCKLRGLK